MRQRLSRIVAALALVLLAAGIGTAVVFGARLVDGPGRESYLRELNEICDHYGTQLDLVPPPDDSAPGSIYETVDKVIPILENLLNEVRGVQPPASLVAEVEQFVDLSSQSIKALRGVRTEALERDIYGAALAFTRFEEVRNKAQALGKRLGFTCSSGP